MRNNRSILMTVIVAIVVGSILAFVTNFAVASPTYPHPQDYCNQPPMTDQQCADQENVLSRTYSYGWPFKAVFRTDAAIPADQRLGGQHNNSSLGVPIPYSVINVAILSAAVLGIELLILFASKLRKRS